MNIDLQLQYIQDVLDTISCIETEDMPSIIEICQNSGQKSQTNKKKDAKNRKLKEDSQFGLKKRIRKKNPNIIKKQIPHKGTQN